MLNRSEFRKLSINTEICSYSSNFFRIKLFPSVYGADSYDIKVGFVISKKFDKRAVMRNKFRRVLKVVTDRISGNFDNRFSYLFIIYKRAVTEHVTFSLLMSDCTWIVRNVIKKAKRNVNNTNTST